MGVEAVDAANLLGLFVGAVLFGLYNGLFLLAMVNIRRRRTGSRVVPLLLIAIWIVTVSLTVLRSISYCSALEKEKTDPQHFRQKFKRKYSAMFPLLQFFSVSRTLDHQK
ncbi:hypothetical protein FRC02_002482 [Tulasnella sp. 418]|nr:hypothetical protein FRC02_002482 [Tulasnella sp. 418]